MTFRRTLHIALLSMGASLLTAQAHAIAITDASILASGGVFVNPSANHLGHGKVKKLTIDGLSGLFAGDPWVLLDITGKRSKTFNNTNFVVSADLRKNSGKWGVTWGNPTLAQPMDFILVLKGGNRWGAYLFESGSALADAGSIDGLFQLSALNRRGKVPKLRQAFIYGRVATNNSSNSGPGGGLPGPGSSSSGSGGGSPGSGGGSSGSGGGSSSSGGGSSGSSGGSVSSVGSGSAPTEPVNDIPVPGSLALLLLGLGLGVRQLSRRPVQGGC